MTQYFFLKDTEINHNPFEQDQQIANWWFSLERQKKSDHLEVAKDLEKQIVMDHNKQKCEQVKESDDEQSSDEYIYNCTKQTLQQLQCEQSVH